MSKGSDAPSPPDPVATSNAQAAANTETARVQAALNRVNQFTPFGNVTYRDLGDDRWRSDIALSPQQQEILNRQQGLQTGLFGLGSEQLGRVGGAMGTPFDYEGIANPPGATDFAEDRRRVEEDYYNAGAKYLDRRRDREFDQLQQMLADRGIGVGNEGYSRTTDDFNDAFNRAYGDLSSEAIQRGGAEQSRLRGLTAADRATAIQERAYMRDKPISDLAAVLGLSGGPQMPQFQPVPQTGVAPTDVSGNTWNAYNANLGSWQSGQNRNNAMMGGLFGLGGQLGAAALMSDRRLKEDIRLVGRTFDGLNVYTFRFRGQPTVHMGVMAQEVEAVKPEAVVHLPDGYLAVDYSLLAA